MLNNTYQLLKVSDIGQISSQEHFDQLDQITIPKNAMCIVCLPGTQVSMLHVTLPRMNKQEMQLAIPNLLEEQLPVPAETCYFATGMPNAENQRQVAVINKARWMGYLEQLAAHEIHPQQIIPDYLALPLTEDDWAILFEDELALARTGQETGFTIESSMINGMIASSLSQAIHQPEDIINITDPDIEQPTVDAPISVIHEPGLWGTGKTTFNMLDKPISTPRSRATLSNWQWCGLSALGFILLLFAGQFTLLIHYHFQQKSLDATILQVAKQISPNIDSVDNTQTTVDNVIHSYRVDPNPFLTTFNQFSQIKEQYPAVKLQKFDFSQEKIKLSLQSRSINNLNNLYQTLVKSDLPVTQNQIQTSQGNMLSQTLVIGAK